MSKLGAVQAALLAPLQLRSDDAVVYVALTTCQTGCTGCTVPICCGFNGYFFTAEKRVNRFAIAYIPTPHSSLPEYNNHFSGFSVIFYAPTTTRSAIATQ